MTSGRPLPRSMGVRSDLASCGGTDTRDRNAAIGAVDLWRPPVPDLLEPPLRSAVPLSADLQPLLYWCCPKIRTDSRSLERNRSHLSLSPFQMSHSVRLRAVWSRSWLTEWMRPRSAVSLAWCFGIATDAARGNCKRFAMTGAWSCGCRDSKEHNPPYVPTRTSCRILHCVLRLEFSMLILAMKID